MEAPKPGDQIAVVYQEGDHPYDFLGGLVTVIPDRGDSGYVWFRIGGRALCRRLVEEGITWARAPGDPEYGGWWNTLEALRAAVALAGTAS